MAKKLIELEEAAKMIGISPDALNEMRNRLGISAYRDGATWKFKSEDIERLIAERRENPDQAAAEYREDDLDSILLSEVELGQSSPSTSSTVIGKTYEPPSPDSDIQLATPRAEGDEMSDVRLATDSEIVSASSGLSSKFDDLDTLDLDMPSASESGVSPLPTSAADITDVEIPVVDNRGALDDAREPSKPPSSTAGGSAIDLAGDEDDDLVLGGSSGPGSDLTHSAGDSGISLVDPSDSGLSLEEAPLELSGSGLDSLDLGGGEDMILLEEDGDPSAATQLKTDDDFLLTPLGEGDEEDSGSQVIALENEPDFDDAASTMLGRSSGVGAGGVMLEEELEPAFDSVSPLGAGAPAPAVGLAATTATTAAVQAETPLSIATVLGLMLCVLLLAFTGMMLYDLMRNMWSWDKPYSVNSSIMDAIVNLFS